MDVFESDFQHYWNYPTKIDISDIICIRKISTYRNPLKFTYIAKYLLQMMPILILLVKHLLTPF
jgi:hypothetical protein